MENADHPNGKDVEVEIVSARLGNSDSTVFWIEEWDDGNGWQFGVRDGQIGVETLIIEHKLVDSNETFKKTFNLHAASDVWNLDLYAADGTNDILTSGGLTELWTSIEHWYYNEEEGGSQRDENINVYYEWGLVDFVDGVTIDQHPYDPSKAVVTTDGVEKNTEVKAYVKVYANYDNSVVAYREIPLRTRNEYYNLTPVEIYDDSEVGNKICIYPELWYYKADETPVKVKDARIWWVWEHHALRLIHGLDEDEYGNYSCAQGTDVFFEVIGDRETSVELMAHIPDENGEYYQVDRRELRLYDKNYDVWFNDLQNEDYGWIYTDKASSFEINTENLQDKQNAELVVSFGRWNEETEEFESFEFESKNPLFDLNADQNPAILTIYGEELQEVLGENRDFGVLLQVMIDGKEHYARQYGMGLREPMIEYHTDWNDRNILPGWSFGIEGSFDTYREDSIYPHGHNEESSIINVTFQQLDGKPGTFWLERWKNGNGWQFGAEDYGKAKVTVTYYDVVANNMAQRSFLVDVVSDVWNIEFTTATDSNVIYPNDFNCVTANVVHERYTENGHETVSTENGYTYRWDICGETDLFTLQVEEKPNKVSVTANSDLDPERYGDGHNIWCRAYYTDENGETNEVAYGEFWLSVQDIYYVLSTESLPVEHELGEDFLIKPTLNEFSLENGDVPVDVSKKNKPDEEDKKMEVYFVWEVDTNAVLPDGFYHDENGNICPGGDAGGNYRLFWHEDTKTLYTCVNVYDWRPEATAQFKRIGEWSTDIWTKAYIRDENGKFIELASARTVLPELNYEIEFSYLRGGDHTWVFDTETDYELSVNTECLENKDSYKNNDIWVEWLLAVDVEFDEYGNANYGYMLNEGEDYQFKLLDEEQNLYDYNTVVINGAVLKEKGIDNFDAVACIKNDSRTLKNIRTNVSVCLEEFHIHNTENPTLANDYDGWYYPDKQVKVYVRDVNYPKGEDVVFEIESLEVLREDGSSEEDDIFRVFTQTDDEGKDAWRITAKNIGSQMVRYNLKDSRYPSKDVELYSGDNLYVMNAYTDPESENMLPGSSKKICVEVWHLELLYDDEGNAFVNETKIPEEQYVLYYEKNSDMIKVDSFGKITAGRDEGFAEVKVYAAVRVKEGDGWNTIGLDRSVGVNIVPEDTKMEAHPLYVEAGNLYSINDAEVSLYKEAYLGLDEEDNEIIERTDYDLRNLKFTHVREEQYMELGWLSKKLIVNDEFGYDFSEGPIESSVYISGKLGETEYTCEVPVLICRGHEYEHMIEAATVDSAGHTYDQCVCCGYTKNHKDVSQIGNITLSNTSFVYNTKVQTPAVIVKDVNGNDIASSNYTVEYSSGSTNVGNYTAVVTFKGDYSGSSSCEYKIGVKAVTPTVTLAKTSLAYNGSAQVPSITVKDGTNVLTENTDYTVSYSSGRTNVGSYTVSVELKGNYSGSKSVTYKITAKKITPTVTLSKTSFVYNGKTQKPTVTVKDGTKVLNANTDYTVSYSSGRTNAGGYTVSVELKGNYSGSKSVTYKITAKKITPTVTLSKTSFVYNGKTQKPTVTVKDGSTKLATSQYTVSYSSGLKKVGKYTVKVTLKDNYSGSNSATYTIVPKGTKLSSVSAGSKAFTVKWSKQTSQTTGYEIQYSTSSKFSSPKTVTVSKNSTTSQTVKKLKAKKKYYVRIRTYKTVSGTKYYSAWSSAKSVTTKK